MTVEPMAVVVSKTQVPNEMLKNPALSIFSAPDTSGPLTIGASVATGITFSGVGPRIRGPMSTSPNITRLMFQTDDDSSSSFLGIIPGAAGSDAALSVYAQPDSTNTHFATLWTTLSPPRVIVGSGKRGTGTTVPLELWTGDTARWIIGADGALAAGADNAYDIGTPSFRARSLYLGGTAILGRDPSANLEAATKQYADTKLTKAQADTYYSPVTGGAYLPLAGGQMTGTLFSQRIEILGGMRLTFSAQPGEAFLSNDGTGLRFSYYGQDAIKIIDSAVVPMASYIDLGAASNRFYGLYAQAVDVGGNLTFTGLARRILADFSNATQSNRAAFQTSVANGATVLTVIPNGTSTDTYVMTHNKPDASNASRMRISVHNTEAQVVSDYVGSGSALPMAFHAGGAARMLIATDGSIYVDQGNANTGTVVGALRFGAGAGEGIGSKRDAGAGQFGLDFYTASTRRLRLLNTGGGEMSLAGGTTNPYTPILDLLTPTNATGAGVFIRFGNTGVWSVGMGTFQGQWWHAFTDSQGIVQWGYDGTRVRLAGQAGWTALPLQGGWANYGGGFGTASYRKTADGTVWLTGLIAAGPINTPFTTMPVGFRIWLPADHTSNYQHFVAMTASGIGLVTVSSSGAVNCTSGSNGWVDLSNLHWQAA